MRRTPRRWTPVPPHRAVRDRDRHRASDRWRARVRTAQGAAPGAPRSQTSGGRRARTPRSDGSIVSTSPIGARAGANAPVASGGPGCRGCCRDRVGRLQFAARRREFGDPGRTGGHRGHVGEGAVDAGTAEDSAGAKAPAPAAASETIAAGSTEASAGSADGPADGSVRNGGAVPPITAVRTDRRQVIRTADLAVRLSVPPARSDPGTGEDAASIAKANADARHDAAGKASRAESGSSPRPRAATWKAPTAAVGP